MLIVGVRDDHCESEKKILTNRKFLCRENVKEPRCFTDVVITNRKPIVPTQKSNLNMLFTYHNPIHKKIDNAKKKLILLFNKTGD